MDRQPINVPLGNSRTVADEKPYDPEDRLSGDKWTDYKKALAVCPPELLRSLEPRTVALAMADG
jgi:hypothetical protein